MNQDDAGAALVAAVSFLEAHAESTGKVGAVGYCFGGLMVNRLAASSAELDAGVAYYGRQVPAAQVPNIKAALMLHYAENDEGVNAGIAAYEAALQANNKKYTLHMYPGTQHAFNNDTAAGPIQQGSRRPRLQPHARVLRRASGRAAESGREIPQRTSPFEAARSSSTKS